jgi:hypothetical protein
MALDPAWQEIFRHRPKLANPVATSQLASQGCQSTLPRPVSPSAIGPWGDPFQVEALSSDPTSPRTRLVYANLNGLGTTDPSLKFGDTLRSLHGGYGADILCFAEHNVSIDADIYAALYQTARRHSNTSATLVHSTSAVRIPSGFYKPGGTLTTVLGDWTTRVCSRGTDDLGAGRWSYCSLQGKQNKCLYIVTAYRVSQTTLSQAGPLTAFAQQWLLLRKSGQSHPNPRSQVLTDLTQFIFACTQKGAGVILSLDANESLSSGSGLTDFLAKTSLVDVHSYRHGACQHIPTYARGATKIDHILVTPDLLPFVHASGFFPFYEGIDSDHRVLFCDLNLAGYLRGQVASIESPSARALDSRSPRRVSLYKQKLYKHLQGHNVFNRLMPFPPSLRTLGPPPILLPLRPSTPSSPLPVSRRKPRSAKFATCRGLPSFGTHSSATSFSASRISRSSMAPPHLSVAQLWLVSLIPHPTFLSGPSPQYLDSSALLEKLVPRLFKRLPSARAHFLAEQASALAKAGKLKQASILHRLRTVEQKREMFARLQRCLRPAHRGGLTHLLVPEGFDENSPYPYEPADVSAWEPVYDSARMESLLLHRNVQHFGQAHGTPFTVSPLADLLGPHADTPFCNDLLSGILPDVPGADPQAIKLLRKLASLPQAPPIDHSITAADFEATFSKWRESTSTSPSNVHLGHYRSLISPDGTEPSPLDSDEAPPDHGRCILGLRAQIANLCVQNGLSLQRWQRSVTVMLEKLPGRPLLHKLRVIHLLEADYQATLKILIARRLLWHSEQSRSLGDHQSGSRPGRTAEDVLVTKALTDENLRRLRINAGMFDNDASACYDRMILPLVNLLNRKHGLSASAAKLHSLTLEKMQYFVKTTLGISQQFYQSSDTRPLYGTGQGATDSPVQWGFISVLAFSVLDDESHGLLLRSPDLLTEVLQTISAFVDDSSNYTGDYSGTLDPAGVARLLEQDAQRWSHLLHATGGALELTKCFYYIMFWSFDASWGTPRLLDPTEIPYTLTLSQGSRRAQIEARPCGAPYKILGTWRTMTGDMSAEAARLKSKSDGIASRLLAAGLPRSIARLGYDTMYVPAMTYANCVSSLTESQAEFIQCKATSVWLSALGYNRNTPRAVVYGPKEFGGLGFRHLHTEQGISGVLTLLKHLRAHRHGSALCRLVELSIANLDLEAGLGVHSLTDPHVYAPHISPGWLQSVRAFLHEVDGSLHNLQTFLDAGPHRTNDVFLMPGIARAASAPSEVTRFNYCRLYLRVQRLSDLASADGRFIDPRWLHNDPAPLSSSLQWPHQGKPGHIGWRLWRRLLRTAFCSSGSWRLRHPLGPWVKAPELQTNRHQSLVDPEHQRLFLHSSAGWQCHSQPARITRRVWQFSRVSSPRSPSAACVPVHWVDYSRLCLHPPCSS